MAARSVSRRRCLNCSELFTPDFRNRTRQGYCQTAACRKASKKASQARWLAKPENRNYFRGPANTERNRRWRETHPGHRKRSRAAVVQQDPCSTQPLDHQRAKVSQTSPVQQDPFELQLPLFVGLIANLTASTQQDSIEQSVRRLHLLGREVLEDAGTANLMAMLLGSCASPNAP